MNLEPFPPRKRPRRTSLGEDDDEDSERSGFFAAGTSSGTSSMNEQDSSKAKELVDGLLSPHQRGETYPAVRRDDYVRLLIQALTDLGFEYVPSPLSARRHETPVHQIRSIVSWSDANHMCLVLLCQHRKSAAMLVKESGMRLQSEAVTKFCDGVLRGEWHRVEALLSELDVDDEDVPVRSSRSCEVCSLAHLLTPSARAGSEVSYP